MCQPHAPAVVSPQAASLPMSIIIVGVGPAEFDGKCCVYVQSGPESFRYHRVLFAIDLTFTVWPWVVEGGCCSAPC